MYPILLTLHSYVRWLVLSTLLVSILTAYYGWFNKRKFSRFDTDTRNVTSTTVNIQFLLGISLYFISPLIGYFYQDFPNTIHLREVRFFGMEHSLMMFVAVSLVSIGSAKSKQKVNDEEKFKAMAIWFSIALLIILSSIPWPFTGLVSRPYFR
jgi:hypothetical protein